MSCLSGAHPFLVVAASFVIAFFTVGTALANGAVYYNYWLDEFKQTKGLTSLVSTTNIGLILLLGPLASMLANRFTHKIVVCAGTVLSSAALVSASFTSSIPLLLFTQVICGTGWCFAHVPGIIAATFYWKQKYHGVIIGVIISGIGVAQFVIPLAVEYVTEHYTWRGALLLQGALNLNMIPAALLFTPVAGMKKDSNFLELHILKDVFFINSLFYWIFAHMGISVAAVHIGYVAKQALQVGNRQAAVVIAIFGGSGALARLIHGFISRLPRVNVLLQQMVSLVLMASALFSMPSVTRMEVMAAVAVVAGVGIGSMSLNTLIMIDIVGLKSRTAGFGFFATSAGLGLGGGAPIAGLLSDLTSGNYAVSLYFGGGIQILAVLIELYTLWHWKNVRARHLEALPVQVPIEDDVPEDEEEL